MRTNVTGQFRSRERTFTVWSFRSRERKCIGTKRPGTLKVTVCHTAGHYGEEYDDRNSAVLRSRRNCSSDGAERTDDGRAFHTREGSIAQCDASCGR